MTIEETDRRGCLDELERKYLRGIGLSDELIDDLDQNLPRLKSSNRSPDGRSVQKDLKRLKKACDEYASSVSDLDPATRNILQQAVFAARVLDPKGGGVIQMTDVSEDGVSPCPRVLLLQKAVNELLKPRDADRLPEHKVSPNISGYRRRSSRIKVNETFAGQVADLFWKHKVKVSSTKGETPSTYVETLAYLLSISTASAHELARKVIRRRSTPHPA